MSYVTDTYALLYHPIMHLNQLPLQRQWQFVPHNIKTLNHYKVQKAKKLPSIAQ